MKPAKGQNATPTETREDLAATVRGVLTEPRIAEAFHDEIRHAFARGAYLAIEEMKKGAACPETIEVELPREEIAKLAKFAAAAGETLNEFVVRSIGDILDAEGITKEACR